MLQWCFYGKHDKVRICFRKMQNFQAVLHNLRSVVDYVFLWDLKNNPYMKKQKSKIGLRTVFWVVTTLFNLRGYIYFEKLAYTKHWKNPTDRSVNQQNQNKIKYNMQTIMATSSRIGKNGKNDYFPATCCNKNSTN